MSLNSSSLEGQQVCIVDTQHMTKCKNTSAFVYTLFFFLFLFKRDFSDLFEIESMNDRVGEGAEAEGEADSAEQGA